MISQLWNTVCRKMIFSHGTSKQNLFKMYCLSDFVECSTSLYIQSRGLYLRFRM